MKHLDANGQITSSGDITLDWNFQRNVRGEKRNIVFYGAHEGMMHRLMQLAPVETQALIDGIIQYKNAGLPIRAVTETQKKKSYYGSKGKRLTIDKAMEEVSADFIFRLYNYDTAAFKSAIERVVNGNDEKAKQGVKEYKNALDFIISKLKELWNKLRGKGEDQVRSQVKQTIDEFEHLRDLVESALRVAADRVKAEQANPTKGKKAAQQDGIQNSIYESYAAEMLAWDGKSKHLFTLGTTSTALRSIGVKDSEIQLRSGKVKDILNNPEHDMDRVTLSKLPEVLENPIAILKSKQVTKDNMAHNDGNTSRLVMFGTVNDAKGVPVSVVLELLPKGKGGRVLELSVIASAYGKTTNMSGFVQDSEVLYLDDNKKRIDNWLISIGVQFPFGSTNYDPMGSVTYFGNKVNTA